MFDTLTRMGASAAGAYEIERSLRFNNADNVSLTRTPSSSSAGTKATVSLWFKLSDIHNAANGGNLISRDDYSYLQIHNEKLYFGNASYWMNTAAVFRDFSAWYHVMVVIDTTQGTATNRQKIYVNGVQQARGDTVNDPAEDASYEFLNGTEDYIIGKRSSNDQNFMGYMAEIHFADGQALDPTSFGETNADTGQWVPIKYAGSYGTNGFYLNFSDNSGTTATTLGKDQAGSNNWTPNNFSVAAGVGNDSLEDTPTNNYATINPLAGYQTTFEVPANGNLDFNLGSTNQFALSSFLIPSSGKWYAELVYSDIATGRFGITNPKTKHASKWNGVEYYIGGIITVDDSTVQSSLTTVSNGDIVGIKVDRDAGTIAFTIGGSASGSAVNLSALSDSSELVFMASRNASAGSAPAGSFNFGQRAFSHLPADYKALCTANLPEPTIKKGSDHFNTVLYTGNSGTHAITGVGFSPDFTWITCRTDARSRTLVDSVRGFNGSSGRVLQSESSAVEWESAYFNSLDSDGFTVSGSENYINNSSHTYQSWNWKGSDSAAAANDDGTIDSTVSVNATAGFSVGTFSGTGSAGTIGHGLGVAPQWILIKNRDSANSWAVYHDALGADIQLLLNSSNATTGDSNGFNEVPTSSVINVGSGAAMDTNKSGGAASHVFYAFSGVEGYSKFGSYTGNGNADGAFVYTGFRPAFIMSKCTNHSDAWHMFDSTRDPDNLGHHRVQANLDDAESTSISSVTSNVDILSNGFKWRGSSNDTNGTNNKYIYLAFAEAPFKYSNPV